MLSVRQESFPVIAKSYDLSPIEFLFEFDASRVFANDAPSAFLRTFAFFFLYLRFEKGR